MMIIRQAEISFLNEKLDIPATGFEQDWEIQLADSTRIGEFIDFYRRENLTIPQKQALMALIVASFDNALNDGMFDAQLWKIAADFLKYESPIHNSLIDYWCIGYSGYEMSHFKIFRYINKIRDELDSKTATFT